MELEPWRVDRDRQLRAVKKAIVKVGALQEDKVTVEYKRHGFVYVRRDRQLIVASFSKSEEYNSIAELGLDREVLGKEFDFQLEAP